MPMFVTIGYGDQAGYDRTPELIRNAAHAHDAALQKTGVLIGTAGLPIQVRNAQGNDVHSKSGTYMHSVLPVAGFAIIEAANMEEAIAIVAKSPCAVADGVIEVWPLVVR